LKEAPETSLNPMIFLFPMQELISLTLYNNENEKILVNLHSACKKDKYFDFNKIYFFHGKRLLKSSLKESNS